MEQLKGATEDNVLTLLAWDEKYSAELALQITPDLFSTRAYQKIATVTLDYLERYHHPPRAHLRDLLESDLTRGDEGTFLRQILDAMEGLHEDLQADYVLSTLVEFISIRKLSHAVANAADALHAGNLEEAREALFAVDTTQVATPGVWLKDTTKWLSFLNVDDREFISSGIDALDEKGVHPAKKELYLFIAAAKRGKSWSLIEIGKRALIEGHHNVLHISLENSAEITQQRYTQAFLGLTWSEAGSLRVPIFHRESGQYSKTEFVNINPERLTSLPRHELIKQLKPIQRRGKMLVKWFPTGTLTIAQLAAYLDMLERIENFKPDILLLDYADLMFIDGRNLRVDTGRVFRDLRGLAGIRDLAVVTATQGNRLSNDSKWVTSSMVAEDWSKVGTADTVITYSQTDAERELGLARVLVSAARNAADRWYAWIAQSYPTGQFCLDSVYMNKVIEGDVKRMTGSEEDEDEG